MGRSFLKMNGLGNDFVVIETRTQPFQPTAEEVRAIADRATGVGCDQLIAIDPSAKADAGMRIWNADGSEVDACGNATRCVGWILMQSSGRDAASIETAAGILYARRGEGTNVSVDMGEPGLDWTQVPLAEEMDTRNIELQVGPIDAPVLHSPSVASMGNPHAIFWVDRDVWSYELERFGPLLENHPIFPEKANITVAQVTGPDALTIRTWERGAGLTRACGTAACAAAVCAARTRRTGRTVAVTVPGGGPLVIEWRDDDHVVMTGPAEWEFSGTFDPATGAWERDAEAVA